MRILEKKIDKISVSDQFDAQLSIRGLIFQLAEMGNDMYEYSYYLTFKKTYKEDARVFNDAHEMPIEEQSFFLKTGDPFVINCCSVENKILDLKDELMRRFQIDEMDNTEDEVAEVQSERHVLYLLFYKRSKSYKRLKIQYERALLEYISYFYKFACVFTASNYRIPLIFKKQFLKDEAISLKLLNSDDDTVALLMEYIISLRVDLDAWRNLNINDKKNKTYGKPALQKR